MSREARNPGLGLGGKRRLAPVAQIVLSQPEIRTPGKSKLCLLGPRVTVVRTSRLLDCSEQRF